MTGDWLDRAALASDERISRRGILQLAAASALALGPLGTLVRAPAARAAPEQSGDCLDCTLTQDAMAARFRSTCATHLLGALAAAPVSGGASATAFVAFAGPCLGGVLHDAFEGYDH